MELFDSHCHFDFSRLTDEPEKLWAECRELGIRGMMIPGVALLSVPELLELAERCEGVVGAAGLHPWSLESWTVSPEDSRPMLEQLLAHPKCRAVGECGLDGAIELSIDAQIPYLEMQLELAEQHQMPVILHVRRAHNELQQVLKGYSLPAGGVVHAFSGSRELAERYWKMGLHLGIGGTITYERAGKTRQAVAAMPLEALLLETDAPDMPLSGRQGQPNSPLFLPEVAEELAALRGESVADIAAQTTENSRRLFLGRAW